MDGEQYGKDVGVLWAAHKAGSFELPEDIDKEAFAAWVERLCSLFNQIWLIEDDSKVYNSGRGPVGIVGTNNAGLMVTVEAKPFKWATTKNKLKCSVSFLQMIRYSKKTGVCMVKGKKEDLPLLHKLKEYDVLHYVGKVDTNQYMFSVRGRGSD